MNFTLFLLVAVLLCDGGLSRLAAKTVDNEVERVDVNRIEKGGDNIKFTDIIFDVLAIILDFADVASLINLGKAIPVLSPLTDEILDRQNFELFIHSHTPNDYINATKYKANFSCNFFTGKTRVETNDSEIALKTLEHCGPIIRRLNFQSATFNKTETIKIANFINKFGSASLTHLNLNGIREYTLEQFSEPFSNVEELEFEIFKIGTKSKYPLNQLFPKLRRLNLYLFSNTSFDFIVCEFPHLEHLLLSLHTNAELNRRGEIENIFRKNPHIRSLNVNYYEADFLVEISNLLPNLEHLILPSTYQFGSSPFSFEQVKHVEFEQHSMSSMEMISFPRLESLKMKASSQYYKNWMEFVERHRHIKALHVDLISNRQINQLPNLIAMLPELIKLKIESYDRISIEIIKQIISSHEQLMTFEILFSDFEEMEGELNNLRVDLENDWQFIESKSSSRYFNGFLARRIK